MLKGKIALITGAGTGIGRAIALRLAREGVGIALNYSRSEGLPYLKMWRKSPMRWLPMPVS